MTMAGSRGYPDPPPSDRDSTSGARRWLGLIGVVLVIVVLVVVVMMLMVGGGHQPPPGAH
jgi:hypothetical protein